MGIGINSIGNYGMYANRVAAARKSTQINAAKNVSENSGVTKPRTDTVINSSEKEFFAELYPDKKEMIMDYHFYQRTGEMSGVAVGSIINRRG